MTLDLPCGLMPDYGIYRSVGQTVGDDAAVVDQALKGWEKSFLDTVVFGGKVNDAVAQLNALYAEATSNKWDESGGKVPSQAAYVNTRALLHKIPASWQQPNIDIDPDGEFSLEWMMAPRRRISLSVGAGIRVSYAWIIGPERSYGIDVFDGCIPLGFAAQAKRVFGS